MSEITRNSTQLYVNGVPQQVRFEAQSTFSDFLRQIYATYRSEEALISSLKVDGIELSDQDETAISALPIGEITRIDVVTTHPKVFVEETLQTLRIYAERLKVQCGDIAAKTDPQELDRDMVTLLDGLQVMVDTLTHVKAILKVTQDQEIALLEADLLSTLQDLLQARQEGKLEYVREVVRTLLVESIQEWIDIGIPRLIRIRDS